MNEKDNIEFEPKKWFKWWVQHKNKVYGVILVIVGMFGGNVDRIPDLIGSLIPTQAIVPEELQAQVNNNSSSIEELSEKTAIVQSQQKILREDVDKLLGVIETLKDSSMDRTKKIMLNNN